jgi:tetratricopeptide (TPR) repeat protein
MLFAEALRCHQSGRTAEAERLYRRVLALDGRQLNSLHNLGIIACQSGRQAEGVELFTRAIAVNGQIEGLHNSLGNALKEVGRFDEAAVAYDRAIALRPDFAVTHYNVGNLHLDLGRMDEAAAAYRRAIALNPDFAEPHYNLANILRDRGWIDEAANGYRRAIALRPDHAQSHNNLGNLLKDHLRLDEAVQCYLSAIAAAPRFAFAHNNLGLAYQLQGRLGEALVSLQRAVELDPDYPEAHNNLGVVLQDLGRLTEAAEGYRRAVALRPGYAEAHHNLAWLGLPADGLAEAELELDRLTHLLGDAGGAAPADRSQLLFALGKTLEDRGAFEDAFACLAEANTLRRAEFVFDIAAAEQRLHRIAQVFDAPRIERLGERALNSRRPVFVFGMPRSGTTLVEQIISAHPEVHGAGELASLPTLVAGLRGPGGTRFPACVETKSRNDCGDIGRAYLDSLDEIAGAEPRVTDKWLSNFEQLGLIQACLPNATLIHCTRDPRDVGLSCYATRFVAGQEYAYDLGELGRYLRAYDRLMDHWRAVLPPGRMLEVPYEAVVEDVETWARRLIAHCGLEWNDACLRFFESDRPVRTASSAQVRRPIYAGSVGRWRRFRSHLEPLLEALGEPWASAD